MGEVQKFTVEPTATPDPAAAEIAKLQEEVKAGSTDLNDLSIPAGDQKAPAADPNASPKPDPNTPTDRPPSNLIKSLEEEFKANGKLSEASEKKLESFGLSKADVEAYIQFRQEAVTRQAAEVARQVQEVYDTVGGVESAQKLVEWGKAHLTPAEKADFNKVVATKDPAAIKMALKSLQSTYTAKNGEVNLMGGNRGPAVVGFQNTAQMVAAMNDPRYDTDPAYRAEVVEKIKHAAF